ncbi:MAG: HEAT repeat domain-containing protein [Desulfocapsaceae bacterium]|nr:HEAT repeat domain-containing protein [Desulfocapsaceae bacterium]
MGSRRIKQEVLALLALPDLDRISTEMRQYAEQDVVNPLFSALSRSEEMLRWHAVSIFGQVVPRLADQDMEAARIVMRRFLWSLNDESGGVGWGAPEAMAEIMLHHDKLAEEYLHMLLSYLHPDGPLEHQDGNFLELPALQCGLLWGIGRLASRLAPKLISLGVVSDLLPYLQSEDGGVRGLGVWSIGVLLSARVAGSQRVVDALQADQRSEIETPVMVEGAVLNHSWTEETIRNSMLLLATDSSQLRLYQQGQVRVVTVAELVADALIQINSPA